MEFKATLGGDYDPLTADDIWSTTFGSPELLTSFFGNTQNIGVNWTSYMDYLYFGNADAGGGLFGFVQNTQLTTADSLYLDFTGIAGFARVYAPGHADVLIGYNGNDFFSGGGGADTLTGGAGDDTFSGSLLQLDGDTITDLTDEDRIVVTDATSATTVAYTGGVLSIDLNGDGQTVALVHLQNQTIGTYSIDNGEITFAAPTVPTPPSPPAPPIPVTGTDGNDFLSGSEDADSVDAGAGDDAIFAKGGNDIVRGGEGNDTLGGGGGDDELRGGEGDDVLFGGAGNDEVYGGGGDDVAWAGVGDDTVSGANGDDVLGGGNGSDEISGGAGNDVAYGGTGNDTLSGNGGNDWLYGGAGADILTGGKGDDQLGGGAGADTFIFGNDEGDDTIMGFAASEGDRIDLGGQTYTVTEGDDGFALLTLSGGGTIHLAGIGADQVQDGWFI